MNPRSLWRGPLVGTPVTGAPAIGSSNRGAVRIDRALQAVLSPLGVRGLLLELAWGAARAATYPIGLLHQGHVAATDRTTLDHLSPLQRGLLVNHVAAAGTPILLVPGFVDNHLAFAVLRRGLHRRGFGHTATVHFRRWFSHDVRSLAAEVAERVEQVCEETGYERVNIVGHSLGGLVARYFVQRMGGHERVDSLVTLGSPHQGTRWAHGLPLPLVRQLRPGSDVFAELDLPASDCGTRIVAIWSDLDQVIVPQRSARLRHPDLQVRNVLVRGIGHWSLPVDKRVMRKVCDALSAPPEVGKKPHVTYFTTTA